MDKEKEKEKETKEEISTSEGQIREEQTQKREDDIKKREEEVSKREEDVKKREEDVEGLVNKMTSQYEEKLISQKTEYEKRLDEREKVISQLLHGKDAVDNTPSPIDELNARRVAQRRG